MIVEGGGGKSSGNGKHDGAGKKENVFHKQVKLARIGHCTKRSRKFKLKFEVAYRLALDGQMESEVH